MMSPLRQGECLAVRSERTGRFLGTIHCHDAYELCFIRGAAGAKRIVGDSVVTIGDIDLVLIAQAYLPHAWLRGASAGEHEVLEVHFREDIFGGLMDKTCFGSIRHMLALAASGLAFSREAALAVEDDLVALSTAQDGLEQYALWLSVLHRLTADTAAQRIAGPGYVREEDTQETKNIRLVKDYIYDHYSEDIYIKTLADLVGVEEQWLSAFFKYRTGNTINDYINQVRLSHVVRRLMNTEDPVALIANECGFPNLANFNRHFKRLKGTTPVAFRREYRAARI